jgi:hypothetical protein
MALRPAFERIGLSPPRRRCHLRFRAFERILSALLLAFCAGAQEPSSPPAPSAQDTQSVAGGSLAQPPVDFAGYASFRRVAPQGGSNAANEFSASIFATGTLGRFRLHSEWNLSNATEYDSEGINLVHPRRDLSVKLDSATLTYNVRDWLQFAAGFEFVPTYWRAHRYQSVTLTVQDPVTDQSVFPTAFKGGLVKGDKYLEFGGFSYQLYGGVGQQTVYRPDGTGTFLARDPIMGGKFVFHAPCGHWLDACDVGIHLARVFLPGGHVNNLYGGEARLEKGRVGFLSEFAHAYMGVPNGGPAYNRQGFYVQGAYRLARTVWVVARFDRANLDSRFDGPNDIRRRLLGLVFRPVPDLSLKFEANQYPGPTFIANPDFGSLPVPISVAASPLPGHPHHYGVSMSIVYFWHRP